MNYIGEIKNIFSQPNLYIRERVKIVEITLETTTLPKYDDVLSLINKIPSRDIFQIVFEDDSEARIVWGTSLDLSREEYDQYVSSSTGDVIKISIFIKKNVEDNTFSIYCFDEFMGDLNSLSLFDVLCSFSNLLSGADHLNFVTFDKSISFMTRTMSFSSEEKHSISTDFSRLKRIEECKDVSRFLCAENIQLLPDDFKIVLNSAANPLTDKFSKLCCLLSMIYVATSASLDKDKFIPQITGQRSISCEINIDSIISNDNIYKVYYWIFTDGNAADKAIIARNVLSLHCKYNSLIDMDELAFASMQSNYNLYLRNNVNQYLELKNKVADYICDVVAKTGEYATNILDRFKQNLIALIGFLLTTIIANIVSSNPLDNIFTKDITVLVYAILVGSVFFLVISILETNYRVKTIHKAYLQLKENYSDILSKDDISEIYRDDKFFNDTRKEIKSKTILFSIIWILALIGIFFVVEYLTNSPIFMNDIREWIENIYKN